MGVDCALAAIQTHDNITAESDREKAKEKFNTSSVSFINELPTNKSKHFMEYSIPQIRSTHAVTFDRSEGKVFNHYLPWTDHKKGEVVTVEPKKRKRAGTGSGRHAKKRKTRVDCKDLKTKQDKRKAKMTQLGLT